MNEEKMNNNHYLRFWFLHKAFIISLNGDMVGDF